MEKNVDCKSNIIHQIKDKLNSCKIDELKHVLNVISALEASKADGLHYFARFLGIEWNGQDEVKMNLGLHNENYYGVAQALGTFYVNRKSL